MPEKDLGETTESSEKVNNVVKGWRGISAVKVEEDRSEDTEGRMEDTEELWKT